MSQVVTWAIALLALVVSVVTYRLNVRDRRHAWEAQERAQAEEVAGWLVREMCEEHKEIEWKAYVRNSSKSLSTTFSTLSMTPRTWTRRCRR